MSDESTIDIDGQNASMDPAAGTVINNKPVWTPEQIAEYLNRTDASWLGTPGQTVMAVQSDGDNSTINYGFHTSQQSLWDNGYVFVYNGRLTASSEYFNFTPFSAAQQAAARYAMGMWDDLIAVSFKETHINAADVAFSNLTSAPNTQAYAVLPGGPIFGIPSVDAQARDIYGDVWVSLSQASNMQLGLGGYGLKSIIHEVGHALGLSHPGGYNAGQAGGPIVYANHAEYAQDSRMYSIMSYFDAEFTGGGHIDWSVLNWVSAQTPLVHDIAAIQAIYGADTTTRTGDTVYGFNSTAGKDVYDFGINSKPVLSIYDAGGIDTLDFSGFAGNTVLDLNQGAFSSAGGSGIVPLDELKAKGLLPATYTEAQYAALRAKYNGSDGMLHDNISIAYGTVIENAVGSAGNDKIIGNDVGNVLAGNAGNDTIEGRGGDDTLDGGVGGDSMAGGVGNDFYLVDESGDLVAELTGEGTDTVSSAISYTLVDNVEDLILTGSATHGTGNALNNVLTGNALSNHLNGGAGDDRLVGGDGVDFMTGGLGNDIFVGEINASKVASKGGPISLDVVLDFAAGDVLDLSGIDANSLVEGNQAFTLVNGANPNNAGELSVRHFGNMNAAEAALGMELDGVDGASPFAGPVSVVFGNVDGGAADFAMVFVSTPTLTTTDFIL